MEKEVEAKPNTLFRSQPMTYVSISAINEIGYDVVRELGNFGNFHVVDLNQSKENIPDKHLMVYKKRVQECIGTERKLQELEKRMSEFKNIVVPAPLPEHLNRLLRNKDNSVLPEIRSGLDPLEERLTRSSQVLAQVTKRVAELTERKYVLEKCRHLQIARKEAVDDKSEKDVELGERNTGPPVVTGEGKTTSSLGEPLLAREAPAPGQTRAEPPKFILPKFRSTLTGVLPTDRQSFFQRMLYRISRGNAISEFYEIKDGVPDAVTGELVQKSVFSVTLVVSELLEKRIGKVCQLFQATIVVMPDSQEGVNNDLAQVEAHLKEQEVLRTMSTTDIERALNELAQPAPSPADVKDEQLTILRHYQYLLRCEKSISDTMMKCNFGYTMFAMEGWCPVDEFGLLKAALNRGVPEEERKRLVVESNPEKTIRPPGMPPTYFKTNKFTSIFQGIVNTYGVPRYQEVNPGLFTIVTFPFLFGVMYGDVGHGTFLTILSGLMILFEDRMNRWKQSGQMNEILRMCFEGRYLLICMGIAGIYCGSLYNDCMSLPMSLYKTTWTYDNGLNNSAVRTGGVYPYGVDPKWYHTKNQLTFFNGMKMKTAVIIGVTQMTFGIFLGLFNHIHFDDQVSIWLEFLPQLTFMMCTFGYMITIILIKWCIDWSQTRQEPPNLIQTMIGMFLSPGHVASEKLLYEGQATVQGILLLFAFLSIPVMFLGKPIFLTYCKKPQHHGHAQEAPAAPKPASPEEKHDEKGGLIPETPATGGDSSAPAAPAAEEGHSFGDYMIHQSIHTIEFVLGAVSNTASYLRLWALSLAHSELADVFWTKLILEYGLYKQNAFFSMITFAAWFAMTVGVLLMMDVLECFLHALRLHWVEFQNKFFHADGYAFHPFNYDSMEEN